MASNTTYADGSFAVGTYDVTIDSLAYTLDTISHELPVSEAHAYLSTGLPKGGAYIKGKQKINCKINAVTGTAAPSQMVKFTFAFHGFTNTNWIVTSLKINSANTGAQIRTYDATIMEVIN